MRDCVVSLRVFLIVVLMALVLMSGTAFAGDFWLYPNWDSAQGSWPYPSGSPHWYLVDEYDNDWTDFIATNLSGAEEWLDLTSVTLPDEELSVWVQGKVDAIGPAGGVGWIAFYVKREDQLGPGYCMGTVQLYTSAPSYTQVNLGPWHDDEWTQERLNYLRVVLKGWRPVYQGPPYTTGSVACDEVRLHFSY